MDRVNDLVEFRLDAVLQEMSGATLWVLPLEEPFSCEEFVQTTRVNKDSLCITHVLYTYMLVRHNNCIINSL